MKRDSFFGLPCALLVATALVCSVAARAAEPSGALNPQKLLAQAETIKNVDHSKFLRILKKLNNNADALAPEQHWHLLYLDAWQGVIAGRYAKAVPILDDIIAHSGDAVLVVRASGLKINILTRQSHYGEAYELANKLISDLPGITNKRARIEALIQIIQMLSFAGQFNQAKQYIKLTRSEAESGTDQCKTGSYALNALYVANKLSTTNPQLKKVIELCLANKQAIFAHTLQLDKASLLIEKGKARQAIVYLHHIASSIVEAQYQSHIVSLHSTLAEAYLAEKNYPRAQKEALTAIALNPDSDSLADLQDAYKTLYLANKETDNYKAALGYYEKYVKLNTASINDAKARALAYQMARQDVVSKKLKLESVTKQNRILKLQKDLDSKAAETSRLYIMLLLALVLFIGLLLYWTKHSQMRFRRMARRDGLTGTANRQHFFDEVERTLKRLRRDHADACLVLLDLDHFKRINDTYGHAAGDEVLKRIVVICRKELRASDIFGRLGGEEFGILMPGCSRGQGIRIGDRIRNTLAATSIQLNTKAAIRVSASFGLASSDISGYTLSQLFTDADAALYSAKRGGRNLLVADTGEEAEYPSVDSPAMHRPAHE